RNRSASVGGDKIKGIPKRHPVILGHVTKPVAKWRVRRTAEGLSGRVKFLPLTWAGMPKMSFRKNSDSPLLIFGMRLLL
uniref:hypothetical protein n=1 Tax=Methyloprofundus sp. TaxID=2020875 RepID=UPI00261DFDFB